MTQPTILFSTGDTSHVVGLDAAAELIFRNGDESAEQITAPELDAGDVNRDDEVEGELDAVDGDKFNSDFSGGVR